MAKYGIRSASFWLFALFSWVLFLSSGSDTHALAAPVAGGAGKVLFPVLESDFKKMLKKGALDKSTGKLPADKSFFFTGTTGGASEVKDLKQWAVNNDLQHVTGIFKDGMDKPKRFTTDDGTPFEAAADKYWNDMSGFYTKWSTGKAYVAIPGGKDGIASVNKDSIFYKTELQEMQKAESGITKLFVMDSKKMPNSLADVTDEWPLQKATSSSSGGVVSTVEGALDKIV